MGSQERKYLLLQGPSYHTPRRPVTCSLDRFAEEIDPLGIRVVSTLIKQAAQEAKIPVEVSLKEMIPGKVNQLESLIAAADAVFCSSRFFDACLAQEVVGLASRKGVPVVAGGYGPTFNPEFFEGATLVKGEFEPVAGQVMEDLFRGRLAPEYDSRQKPPWDYQQDYVWPDQSLDSNQLFTKLTGRRRKTQNWMAGCNNFCTYCTAVRMQRGGGEKGVRYRLADDIIAEIETLGLNRGDILFLTDNNTGLIPREVLVPVLTFLKNEGIYIMTEAALAPLLADYEEHGPDRSLLKLMSTKDGQGGCLGFAYGADDLVREKVAGSKDKDLPALLKGAPLLRELGIPLHLMTIVGLDNHLYPETFFQVASIFETVGAPANLFFIATPYKTAREGEPKGWGDKVYEQGRVNTQKRTTDFTHSEVVFRPKQMTEAQLQQGFYWLWRQRYSPGRIMETFRRNFDARIVATNPFLASLHTGLAWGAFRHLGLREISARGYLDSQTQRFLDEEYKRWKKRNV
jgi:hypothetical protein